VPDSASFLDRFGFVTSDIRRDLDVYVALLAEWQKTHNLVSRSSLDAVWTRHIADSLQLLDHAPPFKRWLDLGSGAGFPGLVVAIARKADLDQRFTLIEANSKKAAFLRAAVRETGARAEVTAERIEDHADMGALAPDILSARALAPLPELCALAFPYLRGGSGAMLLLKGQEFVHEAEAAAKSWSFDMVSSPSVTDSGGRVVTIRNLSPKVQQA
jgi:16S rRNA (guanine527-N7)-methyltransferase